MKTLWEKISDRFTALEAKLTGKTAAADPAGNEQLISELRASIEEGQEENATQAATLQENAKTIKDLNARVTELGGQITAKDGEIKTLTDAAKSAQDRAIEMVSAMGIDPAQIPAAPAEKKTGTQAKSLKDQYRILQQTDPAKAGEFYLANRDKPEFYK